MQRNSLIIRETCCINQSALFINFTELVTHVIATFIARKHTLQMCDKVGQELTYLSS